MRLSVSKKLNGLFVSLLTLGIGGAIVLATHLFTTDLIGQLRREVIDSSTVVASRTRTELGSLVEKGQLIAAISVEEFKYPEDRLKFIVENIKSEARIVSIAVMERFEESVTEESTRELWRVFHPEWEQSKNLRMADYPKNFLELKDLSVAHVDIKSVKVSADWRILRVTIPFLKDGNGKVIRWINLDLEQEKALALFSESVNTTNLLLDSTASVIATGDPLKYPLGSDLSHLPLLKSQSKEASSGQSEFQDHQKQFQMGAFNSVGIASLTTLSLAPMDRAHAARTKLLRRTGFLAGIFIFLALALGLIFSRSLTGPLERLSEAAEAVREGNFASRLPLPKRLFTAFKPDEIFHVTQVFNHMVEGLSEREKMRNLFEKFHSKEVAQKLLSGELTLGGERKNAAVLFTDIRSFTQLSEEHSPELIVTLLNRYMTAMVECILRNGGVVDKYIGDAIMALWGVPETKESDIENSLTACIEMREALEHLNADLAKEGLPTLRIGMGIHYGPVIAGNIGSNRRMEYTVMGDTVNTAARIQDLTKVHKTDILVSSTVALPMQSNFHFESVGDNKVRGKTEAMLLFKVNAKAAVKPAA